MIDVGRSVVVVAVVVCVCLRKGKGRKAKERKEGRKEISVSIFQPADKGW